jgi:hypothetical protein
MPEMAAQKAGKALSSRGLLSEYEMDVKLDQMRKEAGNQQRKLEQLIQRLSGSLHSSKLQETEQKASQIIKTWTRS